MAARPSEERQFHDRMDGVDQDKPETDFFLDQAQPTIPPSLQTVLKDLLIGMKAPSWNLVRRVLSCFGTSSIREEKTRQ
jgi:hypothetical protein